MADNNTRRKRLDQPVQPRSGLPRPHYDPEAFGRLSERIARFLGTSRFLVYLTVFCAVWLLIAATRRISPSRRSATNASFPNPSPAPLTD